MEAAAAALGALRAAFPDDSPGQLMERAIAAGDAAAVAGIADGTELDVNAPCDPAVEDSASPLFTALRAGDVRVAGVLVGRDDVSLERSMPAYGAWDWAVDAPLPLLELVVRRWPGAVTRADADGGTLLHAAAEDPRGGDKVALLLDQPGADPDARQADGTSPLYRAALTGDATAVRLLLARGADPAVRNRDNAWSALMVAAAAGHADVVDALLGAAGIEPDARGDRGQTALHVAAEAGHADVVAALARRADVDAEDGEGRTALSLAAFAGHEAVVASLLSAGADPNRVDDARRTALHWAAMGGHDGVVRSLLADPRTNTAITDRPERQTARDAARVAGRVAIADLLDARMRADPGTDDAPERQPPEHDREPGFLKKPLIPEPPGLRGRSDP